MCHLTLAVRQTLRRVNYFCRARAVLEIPRYTFVSAETTLTSDVSLFKSGVTALEQSYQIEEEICAQSVKQGPLRKLSSLVDKQNRVEAKATVSGSHFYMIFSQFID